MRPVICSLTALLATACGPGTDLIEETPSVRVAESSLAVQVGSQAQLGGELYIATPGGDVVLNPAELVFFSTDTSTVSVSPSGVVTGVAVGQAFVEAEYAGGRPVAALEKDDLQTLVTVVETDTSAALVRVVDPSGAETTNVPLSAGSMLQLSAEVENVNGMPVVASVEWSSSDETVASVDGSGLVTAVGNGVASILARVDELQSRAVTVSVFDVADTQRSGSFQGLSGYRVNGTATLEFNEDGELLLSFGSDFSSSNGPDLDVVLSTSSRVTGASVNLGEIQSTRGAQTYAVPEDVVIDQFDFVIIQCVAFNVAFGLAEFGAL